MQAFITKNIEKPIRLDDLSTVAAISPYHLSRKFKRCTGMSPMRFVLYQRVEAAKAKLLNNSRNFAEIAYECGFSSQAHFCTSFKLITGMTATQWRKALMKTAIALFAAPKAADMALMLA